MCGAAAAAARAATRAPAPDRIADSDPSNMECRISSGGYRLDIVDQPSVQAWTEFDTTEVHFNQAYGPSAAHDAAEIPRSIVRRLRALADWIPAQRELFATDGTQSRGGSYVTVTVSHRRAGQVRVATAVALAVLRAGPPQPAIVPPT